MGYYVNGNGHITINAENYDAAFNELALLNANDELKTGGRYGGEPAEKPVDSTSVAKNPDKWFSWMEWNYDEIYTTVKEIFEQVGFEVTEDFDEDGNSVSITLAHYDNKMGAEKHFVKSIAPYVEDGSIMEWRGEDDDMWRWVFEDGTMKNQEAQINWV